MNSAFPKLRELKVTSPATSSYNCIAWAMGDNTRWWWPKRANWPSGVQRETTVEAFEAAFQTLGYTKCANGEPEPGFEKIALYTKDGLPTHAARLLANGFWTSKLGREIDISHEIDELDASDYGSVHAFYSRNSKD